jgi:molybdopterin biosynthesis enzyme MoaB
MVPAKRLLANFVNESVVVTTGGTGIQVTESGLVMIFPG